jgi:CRP-like cAMP-binding protein
LIDRIRHDIQQRLEQLLAEADKLRHALAALDPRERSTPKPKTTSRPAAKRAANTRDVPKPTPARTRTRTVNTANAARGSTRTAPGETKGTKARVLAALSSEHALTVGEVAKTTGLARGTVSTTLSKLSKTGEVVKADRGYRLPSSNGGAANAAGPAATPATADA